MGCLSATMASYFQRRPGQRYLAQLAQMSLELRTDFWRRNQPQLVASPLHGQAYRWIGQQVPVDISSRSPDRRCGPRDRSGHAALQNWTVSHGVELRIGMEPSGGIARRLAYYLAAAGHVVVEV